MKTQVGIHRAIDMPDAVDHFTEPFIPFFADKKHLFLHMQNTMLSPPIDKRLFLQYHYIIRLCVILSENRRTVSQYHRKTGCMMKKSLDTLATSANVSKSEILQSPGVWERVAEFLWIP